MKAIIWTKQGCKHCLSAKGLLLRSNISYEERIVGSEYTKEQLLEAVPSAKSVPQIFLDDEYIGGYRELALRLGS